MDADLEAKVLELVRANGGMRYKELHEVVKRSGFKCDSPLATVLRQTLMRLVRERQVFHDEAKDIYQGV